MLFQHRSSAHMTLSSGAGAAMRQGSRIAAAAAKRSPLYDCRSASTRTPAAQFHAAEAEAAGLPETLTITRPDDWHLHVRDGDMMAAVLPHTAATFGRAIIMPNLQPPVTDVEQVDWPLRCRIWDQPTRIAVLRRCKPHECCGHLKQYVVVAATVMSRSVMFSDHPVWTCQQHSPLLHRLQAVREMFCAGSPIQEAHPGSAGRSCCRRQERLRSAPWRRSRTGGVPAADDAIPDGQHEPRRGAQQACLDGELLHDATVWRRFYHFRRYFCTIEAESAPIKTVLLFILLCPCGASSDAGIPPGRNSAIGGDVALHAKWQQVSGAHTEHGVTSGLCLEWWRLYSPACQAQDFQAAAPRPGAQVKEAVAAGVVAYKMYPAGATTNSDSGVTDVKHVQDTLQAMADVRSCRFWSLSYGGQCCSSLC